ncbi:MAG: hypothetical protein LW826_03120 [Candidatus Jidaibacter sp.]|nr:hypothetical protein [Candidatus Jidaibacter sp.]
MKELNEELSLGLKFGKEKVDGAEIEDGKILIVSANQSKTEKSIYINVTNVIIDRIASGDLDALHEVLSQPSRHLRGTTNTPAKGTEETKLKTALNIANNKYGLKPLAFAIVNKNKQAALAIINYYKIIDDGRYEKNLLALAIKIFDDSDVALALINKGFAHNEAEDFNAFYYAAKKGWVDILKKIPRDSKDWKINNQINKRVLSAAIEEGHMDFIKEVIDNNSINHFITDECNSIILKKWFGLLNHGIDQKNQFIIAGLKSFKTENIHSASINIELLKVLIRAGHPELGSMLKPDKLSEYAHLFYDLICSNEIEDTLRSQLLIKFSDKYLNKEDASGSTSLHIAVKNNNCNAVNKLLQVKADIKITDLEGKTALCYAEDNSEIKQVLEDYIVSNRIEMPAVQKAEAAAKAVEAKAVEAKAAEAEAEAKAAEAEAEAKAAEAEAEAKAAEAQRAAAEQPQPQPQPQPNPPVKKPSTAKCIISGGIFSALSSAVMYGIYTNQHVVLENAYFFAAQTALANNEYGNMLVSMITNHSQECALAFAALTVVVSFCAGYAISYKLSAKTEEIDVPGIV